jgi:hypothetical protein
MAGRPTKYDISLNDKVYKLALLGATDEEMADILDISESTLNKWKLDYPEFSESIKRGKVHADSNVANRLYQRALGFEHESEDIKVVDGKIVRVPITKIYAPDPTSAIFWLKNRQPNKWRDKQDHEHEHKGSLNIINLGNGTPPTDS